LPIPEATGDVAEVDADAKLDTALGRQICAVTSGGQGSDQVEGAGAAKPHDLAEYADRADERPLRSFAPHSAMPAWVKWCANTFYW
jgi:hypothetical protein